MASRFMLLFVMVSGLAAAQGEDDGELERSVCGLQEPVLFWLWSRVAGSPDPARLAGLRNVEDIAFETRDGRTLRGYRLNATGPDGRPTAPVGYLLVMQGNAVLADQIIGAFARYAAAGLDVYVYDYRGYGRSGGKRRLKAMVSDYAGIRAALDAAGYARRLVYAMSFGGIVFLDGYVAHAAPDRVVIDSTPARLSDHGCAPGYDPVAHLPRACSGFLFIAGGSDSVVTPDMSAGLLEAARQCGASVVEEPAFGHPFMERDPALHRRRMTLIEDFLLDPADGQLPRD